METTIKKTVRGATMEAIFDKCETFSIRQFKAINLESESDYNPQSNYKYEILIRHAEDTDANVLFEEARFKQEILTKPQYTAQKDKIMKATCENFINDLRGKLEALQYKYTNNTRIFDNEQEYLEFCRAQVNATTLKMIAFNEELYNA